MAYIAAARETLRSISIRIFFGQSWLELDPGRQPPTAGTSSTHRALAVTTPSGVRGYQYDANGNLTQVTGPGARTVTWWSFNKPRRLEKDGNNHSEYWYGPGGDRALFRQSARIRDYIVSVSSGPVG